MHIVILGISQDAGYPQPGCRRKCCAAAWKRASLRRKVASLGIVDEAKRWMIDATPDFAEQERALGGVDGVLLTHAHIGHYTGLMYLGREAMGARRLPVWAMPRMTKFIEANAPWSQLVALSNIELRPLKDGRPVRLGKRLAVTPLLVPHRSEFSEVVGFRIAGPRRAVLYVPDIDKWEKWATPLERALDSVDAAWIDGTFFEEGELPGRDPAEVPHPFIRPTLARLAGLPRRERAKVGFIHLNHTNPALRSGTPARQELVRAGCRVAKEGESFAL